MKEKANKKEKGIMESTTDKSDIFKTATTQNVLSLSTF